MNEKIKQLAIQAGFFYEDYKDIWYLEYHNETCDEEIKKFAELIVNECIRYFNDDYQRDFSVLWREDLSDAIRQHFGVEQ